MNSPTARTLAHLRKLNHICQVVERWNSFARRRVDLFNIIDIVVLTPKGILGIQCTSGTNHSSRVQKAQAEEKLKAWLACGGLFEIWSWAKKGAKDKRKLWTLRREKLDYVTKIPTDIMQPSELVPGWHVTKIEE
jgi:hypothetical protein